MQRAVLSKTTVEEIERLLCEVVFEGHLEIALDCAQLLLRTGASLDRLYSGLLQPLLDRVGDGWESGTLRIADEHRCSSTVEALIGHLSFGLRPPRRPRGTILLVPGPDEQHTLGLSMVAHAWTEAGWTVERTWAMPVAELPAYLKRLPDLRLVGLSLSDVPESAPLREELLAFRQALPNVPVLLGGLAVRRRPDLADRLAADAVASDVDDALRLAEDLTNPLTRRERDVLHLVSVGRNNDRVAAELEMGVSTVRTHLDRIYAKLEVRDRAAAVGSALRHDWIE